MVRTQIYLEDSQKNQLEKISSKKHRSMAELIREAVDRYLQEDIGDPDEAFQNAFGIWRNRKETGSAYARRIRREWSR